MAALVMGNSLEENINSLIFLSASLIAAVLLLLNLFVAGTSLSAQVRQSLSATEIVHQMVQADLTAAEAAAILRSNTF